MRARGSVLFERPGLRDWLLDRSSTLVSMAVLDALLARPALSRLQLRRAANRAGYVEPLVLLDPEPATAARTPQGAAPSELRCAVPFRGSAWLFGWSAPLWPPPHAVRGTVEAPHLLLVADGWPGDDVWLPAVLGGEVQEIERIIAAQTTLVDLYNRELFARVRLLVERLYPRISLSALRQLREASEPVDEDDPLAFVSRHVVQEMREQLWREWTR